MYKVCLVEDEVNLNELIISYLEKEGYEVLSFTSGTEALKHVTDDIHLWILDIMLGEDISGYDILKKIREKNSKVPVIFTSARDQELDKIIGLELGSDDYLTKPYSPKELMLRINIILRRVYVKEMNIITVDNYVVDFNSRTVSNNKEIIDLTSLEFDLLDFFVKNQNKSMGRELILNSVWGNNYYGTDRVVDDLVRRLRKKMPRLNINTIYGYGYRLL